MDHKTWLWRKKSSEKTIVVSDKANLLLEGNDEEKKLVTDKAVELEISKKDLNEKLSSALSECNAKDDLVTKHAKVAEEAIAGWEKAEAEALSLKQELDEALQQRVAAEERLAHLDGTLKECVQQLRFSREEQEQRIHDAVLKTSREFEKTRMVLEEKLAETSKKLGKLGIENTHLSKALQVKVKLIEDLSEHKTRAEADFEELMAKLDSMKKENASLKYELRMLEKELEIRNEEREFNRQSADASHKQHLESVKKIAKLEAECQRLRFLVRKRLPGPAALAKMKNEVELLGRDPSDMRRKKLNSPVAGLMVKDFVADNSPETPSKRINFLTERLCAMEEENKTLKETLSKKNDELQSTRIMHARTASNLSQIEAQLGVLFKSQTTMELGRSDPLSHQLSFDSMSGVRNENEVSCTELVASTSISDLEHFQNGKPKEPSSCKTVGISDLSLMDDFVEMEKLAIVSVDKPYGSSHTSSDESNTFMGSLKTESGVYPSDATGKELVPVVDSHSGSCQANQVIQLKDASIGKSSSWIRDILRVVLEHNLVTQKSPDEILEEIRTALVYMNHQSTCEVIDARAGSNHSEAADPLHISGYISWRPQNTSPMVDSFGQASEMNISSKEISNQQLQSNLSKSICKIIELIEGIIQQSSSDNNTLQIVSKDNGTSLPHKHLGTPTGYMVHVFQWKSSELSAVLQQFVQTCNDLLQGKADLENFARDLTSALDWIIQHCLSLQDVSRMRDTIKKHFESDGSQSETELKFGMNSPLHEAEKVHVSEKQLSYLPLVAVLNGQNNLSQMNEIQSVLKNENRTLKDELMNMESAKKDLEERLQSATHKSEYLMIQLQESEQRIASLQTELKTLKDLKRNIEDQIENHKVLSEDLDTQLTVARVELNEARQKFSSLEAELEDRSNCCEELETTCLELQLQLESVTKKEIPKYDLNHEEKQLRPDWEINAASEKLAECQETIVNLGKQLKALASPREAALFDKVISTTPAATTQHKSKKSNHRSSLLEQMLAEDDAEGNEDLKSPKTKEIICTVEPQKLLALPSNSSSLHGPVESFSANETKHKTGAAKVVEALAIVPIKKSRGGAGLLRKLLLRRKRENSKKTSLPMVVA